MSMGKIEDYSKENLLNLFKYVSEELTRSKVDLNKSGFGKYSSVGITVSNYRKELKLIQRSIIEDLAEDFNWNVISNKNIKEPIEESLEIQMKKKKFTIVEEDVEDINKLIYEFNSSLDVQDKYIDSNLEKIAAIIQLELNISVNNFEDLLWINSFIQFIKTSDNSIIEISFNDFVHLNDDNNEEEESLNYKEFLSDLFKLEPNKIRVEFRIGEDNE